MLYYGHKQKIRRRGAAKIHAGHKLSKVYRFPSCVNRARVKMPKDKKIYGAQKLVKHCISIYCSLEIKLLRTQETTRTNKNSQQVQKRSKKQLAHGNVFKPVL